MHQYVGKDQKSRDASIPEHFTGTFRERTKVVHRLCWC